MDIDVDLVWRQFDEKEKSWFYIPLSVRVCLAYGICNRRSCRWTPVHEHILVAPRRHREIWLFYVARDAHDISLLVGRWQKGNQALYEVGAVDVEQAVGERSCGCEAVELSSVHDKREADTGMCERVDCEYSLYATFLRRERAQELAPRRDVAEEVAHLYERPRRASRRARLDEFPCIYDDLCSFVRVVAAGHERKSRY